MWRPVEPDVFGYPARPRRSSRTLTSPATWMTWAHVEPSCGSRSNTAKSGASGLSARDKPRVHFDASEVRHPHERFTIGDHAELDRLTPMRAVDWRSPDPARGMRRALLLVEEVLGDSVRIAGQRQRPAVEVGDQERSDRRVVLHEIALRIGVVGKHDLVGIGHADGSLQVRRHPGTAFLIDMNVVGKRDWRGCQRTAVVRSGTGERHPRRRADRGESRREMPSHGPPK